MNGLPNPNCSDSWELKRAPISTNSLRPHDVLIEDVRGNTEGESKSLAVFEKGLGLFGSPEDAALLDEIISIAYEERRRPIRPVPA